MNSLKTLLLVSGVILLSSCGDDASSRVNDKNVEASKERVAEANKGFPTMTFTETKHDFGDIVEGDVVETVFKFKNTGKTALIITNARASCGCTIPEYPTKPVQVGEEGEIQVKFNSRGKHGKQNKQITLTTNTENGKEYIYVLTNVAKKQQ